MSTHLEGSYTGNLFREFDIGGTCRLTLSAATFELQINATASHWDIDESSMLRGTWTSEATGIRLRTQGAGAVARDLFAAFAGPEGNRLQVLELAVFRRSHALLLADSANAAATSWYDAEWSRRDRELEARAKVQFLQKRVADAEEAFRAKNYRKVVMLLETMEETLSPAERKKLEIARRQR